MKMDEELGVYLAPAEYVDSDHSTVRQHAARIAAGATGTDDLAVTLFLFIRDLHYGAPDFDRIESFKASFTLEQGGGYCVQKACAFVAIARALKIPSRLRFADVTNHIASERTRQLMQGPVFAWHGYAEIHLHGDWIKVSPTFDQPMCERIGVPPLEFDGVHDAHLQAFDSMGREFMRYEKDHGTFHDVPARFLADEMPRRYPVACDAIRAGTA